MRHAIVTLTLRSMFVGCEKPRTYTKQERQEMEWKREEEDARQESGYGRCFSVMRTSSRDPARAARL